MTQHRRRKPRRYLPAEEEHYAAMYEDTGAKTIAFYIGTEMYQRGLRDLDPDVLAELVHTAVEEAGYVIVRKNPPPPPPDVNLVSATIEDTKRLDQSCEFNEHYQRAQRVSGTTGYIAGWVYYLRVGDKLKIGYTADPGRRLKSYPPDSKLIAIHPGTKATERDMHHRFAHARLAGREWFSPTDLAITEHIATVIADYGTPPELLQPQYRRTT